MTHSLDTHTKQEEWGTHLDQEEGDAIGPEGTTELDVAELGVQFTQIVQLAVFGEDHLLNALDLCVLAWQELHQVEETGLVLGLTVIAIGNLALQGCKLQGFLACAGMSSVHNGVAGLHVEEVELDGVVAVHVLVREEELLSECENGSLSDALLPEALVWVQPVHCSDIDTA